MLSNGKQFIVVDGVTYINEAFIQDLKLTSLSANAQGQPLVEIDLKNGEFTLRAEESKAQLDVRFTSSGKLVLSGLGLGLSDFEKAKLQGFGSISDYVASFISGGSLVAGLKEKIDVMEMISEAARKGAMAGYQQILSELKKPD
ncbi:hypothetical protein CMV24_29025 [Pseudomonas plecoglossicida]|uniref:DUF1983 domain-containing protein n=1 Tax=Pseudomonas plecoglossicida TaxID=70775 RepID=A0A2A3LW30_PSEDL|nr:hypothetical protein [Pseudomonas plecoglossicida]PBJ92077.1 hypothetical protein CMV24_29025 [Pseudomonas plecoglossicida]